ncbi:MAG: sulfatase-like hydrolase/transferase [Candidatus Micrarchaeaceae archaeon]
MKAKRPNIAVIVLDAARYDAFDKIYGKMAKRFSALGTFGSLKRCIAPASWTLPSHASLFTGMYPSEHGAHETKTVKALDIDNIRLRKGTFLEGLKVLGYKTYGISANPYIHPLYGFTGFDKFKEETYFTDMQGNTIEIPKRLKPLISKYREKYGSRFFKIGFAMLRDDPALITEITGLPLTGALTLRNIAKRFKAKVIEGWPVEKGGKNALASFESFNAKEPFFFFLNLMEAHEPYVGKKGMDFDWPTPFLKEQPSSSLLRLWRKKYLAGVEMALRYAHELSSYIIENYRNSIVIITSDHGQEFGEHNFIGHGVRLDDELVHVPFIVHLPEGFDYLESERYASLVNVKGFVQGAAEGDPKSMGRLFSKTVYAESFGTQSNLMNIEKLKKKINMKKLNELDHYSKRVFRS